MEAMCPVQELTTDVLLDEIGVRFGIPVDLIQHTLDRLQRKRKTPEERFWANVGDADWNGCREWHGSINHHGYGVFNHRASGHSLAHRFSYYLHYGPIPEGMCVCHKCDNRKCVNPDHLFVGTIRMNNIDTIMKGRNRPLHGEDSGNAKLTEDDVMKIRSSELPYAELARIYNISQSHISKIRRGDAWKHSSNGCILPSTSRRKLTDEQVAEIRATDGISQYVLARQYGVTQALISLIKRTNYRQEKSA